MDPDKIFEGYRTTFAGDPEDDAYAVITFRVHRVPGTPIGSWRGRRAAEELAAFCSEFARNFEDGATDPDRAAKAEELVKALGVRP